MPEYNESAERRCIIMEYSTFNKALLELREEYHRNGTIDDSNKKLDEMIKLLTMNFYDAKKGTNNFNISSLEEASHRKYGTDEKIALALNDSFKEMTKDAMFFDERGQNIFGDAPSLYIKDGEDLFARRLVEILTKISFKALIKSNEFDGFDIINEMFGHFIRENFRNNKEDAQYMTPKEVVVPFVKMILQEIQKNEKFIEKIFSNERFIIMDPTCGVGTLMIDVLRGLIHYIENSNQNEDVKARAISKLQRTSLVGQDKVNRMVTFAKINAMFMGCSYDDISNGNSILPGSMLDKYVGKVDVIFTNPPFGALYEKSELNLGNYPIVEKLLYDSIDSEFLLLDRSIDLLEEEGILAIIVPDSVVSAKGLASEFRNYLLKRVAILGVFELPSETFAQAGTRTKTSVLLLKKTKPEKDVFVSICTDVGYVVKNKKGVPVKQYIGTNRLEKIAEKYIEFSDIKRHELSTCVLEQEPSCVILNTADIVNNYLTPNFYDANRITINNAIDGDEDVEFEYKLLSEIAIIDSKNKNRKKLKINNNTKHISLLHINSKQFTIDLQEVRGFSPVSKGIECFENEILVSKLNPRIKRMVVVPSTKEKLICSNEFEILKPREGYTPYELLLMLNSPIVLKQINSLTSGTSSSHNRIKQEQLMGIRIPMPKTREGKEKLKMNGKKFKRAIDKAYESQREIDELNSIII